MLPELLTLMSFPGFNKTTCARHAQEIERKLNNFQNETGKIHKESRQHKCNVSEKLFGYEYYQEINWYRKTSKGVEMNI